MTSSPHERAAKHDEAYDTLAAAPEFIELRRRYRRFAFPATVAFLAWFLLYVVMSNWATDFMSKQVVGNLNVALLFGLLQFATTFALAWAYSRYSTSHLDSLSDDLHDEYDRVLAARKDNR